MLYHGTVEAYAAAILRDGVDLSRCSPLTDFGRGFYSTSNLEQAENWATVRARAIRSSGKVAHASVIEMTVDRKWLGTLSGLFFVRSSREVGFSDFVRFCRLGGAPHCPWGDFQMVCGPVAQWQDDLGEAARVFVINDCDQISFHDPRFLAPGGPLLGRAMMRTI